MRKRGQIALIAVLPLWAFLFYIGWRIFAEHRRTGFLIEPGDMPPLFSGAAWAAALVTAFAICLLFADFVTWARRRSYDRNRKNH